MYDAKAWSAAAERIHSSIQDELLMDQTKPPCALNLNVPNILIKSETGWFKPTS